MSRLLTIALLSAAAASCGSGAPPASAGRPQAADPRVRALADTFLAAYFDRFPETATQYGVPGRRHDKLTDNSLEAQKAWEARKDALARWATLPKYVDTEIVNLREGLRLGYTAPKVDVRIVIDQLRSLVSTPVKDSPFDSPSQRDKTQEFQRQFDALV